MTEPPATSGAGLRAPRTVTGWAIYRNQANSHPLHTDECATWGQRGPCDCGLLDAIVDIENAAFRLARIRAASNPPTDPMNDYVLDERNRPANETTGEER